MSFTTIDAVVAHYPGFQRGTAGQIPADAQIQTWIDNQAARISALAFARGYVLDGLLSSNPQAYALLSLINEVGAAADLGEALFSLLGPDGATQGWANPNALRRSFETMLTELSGGEYDKLFVASARTGDAFPRFGGTAGQEADQDDPEDDSDLFFRKNDIF
jgi:hypothetical protein